jgi:hypothetical protein
VNRRALHHDQVDVIIHQAVCQYPRLGIFFVLADQCKVHPAVASGIENLLPIRPPLGYVVGNSRYDASSVTRHFKNRVPRTRLFLKISEGSVPFERFSNPMILAVPFGGTSGLRSPNSRPV